MKNSAAVQISKELQNFCFYFGLINENIVLTIKKFWNNNPSFPSGKDSVEETCIFISIS